jgi:hypothetical protein
MSKAKSFKTVSGALKSIVNSRYLAEKRANGDLTREQRIENARNNLRAACNHILPQLKINELIREDERPSIGLERIVGGLTDAAQIGPVKDCLKFVKGYTLPAEIVCVGASISKAVSTRGKEIYHVQGWHRDSRDKVHVFAESDAGSGHPAAQSIAGDGYTFALSSNMGEREAAILNADPDLLNRVLDEQTFQDRFQSKIDAIVAEASAKFKARKREANKAAKQLAAEQW